MGRYLGRQVTSTKKLFVVLTLRCIPPTIFAGEVTGRTCFPEFLKIVVLVLHFSPLYECQEKINKKRNFLVLSVVSGKFNCSSLISLHF